MNPNISKEEYFEVLKNIPQFMDAFKETMYAVKETISQSKKASDETKQYYSALIDGLIKLLSNKDISEKDKENIFSIIKDVNAYINELDKRDREFFDKALKVVGTLGVIVLTIVGTIVGIKMSEKLPKNIT
jgi:ABC-type transporter Mla subunit MlaD